MGVCGMTKAMWAAPDGRHLCGAFVRGGLDGGTSWSAVTAKDWHGLWRRRALPTRAAPPRHCSLSRAHHERDLRVHQARRDPLNGADGSPTVAARRWRWRNPGRGTKTCANRHGAACLALQWDCYVARCAEVPTSADETVALMNNIPDTPDVPNKSRTIVDLEWAIL
jgi:hypothetical protein